MEIARLFEADGALHALELTGGSSLANPMYLFRGDAPLQEFAATLPAPVRVGFRFIDIMAEDERVLLDWLMHAEDFPA